VNKNVVGAAKTNTHLKVFNQALITGDLNTAIIALNYYINEQGSANPYADTLAMLYMQQGSYPQCYYWADMRLKTKPEDNGLLEMKGICLEKMQNPKEAIVVFEKLYGKTQNPYHAYKLMELQYSIKRLAECIVTANSAEKLQFKPEYIMTYNVGDQVGRTYLQAGVYNIHGLALYDLDKKAEGKAYFEKAVALDSNFVLAKQNLEAIKTIEGNGNKTNTKPPTQTASPGNKQN
jgi:tetratricopeptide (TPR) repeat protein